MNFPVANRALRGNWTPSYRTVDERLVMGDSIAQVLDERVDRSLQHVFHLLGLVQSRQPLRVAFRCIQTDDRVLRGTALEYLRTILPASIHEKLLTVMGEELDESTMVGSPEQALESLLASRASIELRLGEQIDWNDKNTWL